MAHALYRAERNTEARKVLIEMSPAQDEVNAQRLYLLAELARRSQDDAAQDQYLGELRSAAPASRRNADGNTGRGRSSE